VALILYTSQDLRRKSRCRNSRRQWNITGGRAINSSKCRNNADSCDVRHP